MPPERGQSGVRYVDKDEWGASDSGRPASVGVHSSAFASLLCPQASPRQGEAAFPKRPRGVWIPPPGSTQLKAVDSGQGTTRASARAGISSLGQYPFLAPPVI